MNTIAIFKIIFRGWWRNKLFILISLISLTVYQPACHFLYSRV